MNKLAVLGFFVCILLAPSAVAQTSWVEYEVKEGDTCSSIAADVYGDAARYDLVHQANDLDEPPHDLEPGSILRLPKVRAALLASERGPVMLKSPESDWSRASSGAELYRAWRLNTLERARALLEFRDESELVLRENTLVVIYGATASRTQREQGRAKLESGALRARLGELAGAPITVETESSESFVGTGNALVTVDESKNARVANHGGDPITVRGKSGGEVAVDEGFGSKVPLGRPPSPPKPLPRTPTWKAGSDSFPTFSDATVAVAWEPVAEAKEYFVELTADALGVRVMQAGYVSSDVTALEVQGLPPGSYYATVSAIDDDRFESIPSERRQVDVIAFRFDRRFRLADSPPRFLAGARVESPRGLLCAGAGDEPGETFVLDAREVAVADGVVFSGHLEQTQIECRDSGGAETLLAVEVEIPPFTLEGPTVEDGVLLVPAGRTTGVDVVFEHSFAALEPQSNAVESEFVAISSVLGRLRVGAAADSDDTARLALTLGGTPVLNVPVRVTRTIESSEQATGPVLELGALVTTQGAAAVLLDPSRRGGVATTLRPSAHLIAGRHFRAGAFVDIGAVFADSQARALGAFGVEAVGLLPLKTFRPFVRTGFQIWIPQSARLRSSIDASIGTDVLFGADHGLKLGGRMVVFESDTGPLVSGGGFAGYFRDF